MQAQTTEQIPCPLLPYPHLMSCLQPGDVACIAFTRYSRFNKLSDRALQTHSEIAKGWMAPCDSVHTRQHELHVVNRHVELDIYNEVAVSMPVSQLHVRRHV
jgi:hypothetical protein